MAVQRFDNNIHQRNTGGFATLLSVLIVGAVGASMTVSLLLMGADNAKLLFALASSKQAFFLADSCVEYALEHIRQNNAYTGTQSLSFDVGNCEYTITADSGPARIIHAKGVAGTATRRIRAEIDQIKPNIHISFWQETAE